jgi:hypothetical protein
MTGVCVVGLIACFWGGTDSAASRGIIVKYCSG